MGNNDYADDIRKQVLGWTFTGIAILAIFILLFGTVYTIPAGYRGVLLTFGKPDMVAQGEGLHFKMPIVQSIVKMDTRTQKYTVEKTSSASKDLQVATTDVTINYIINPETVPVLYQEVGVHYQDNIITPAVLEVVKASTAQYTAEELITRRPEVKDKIDRGLTERLANWNIDVQAVSITNFDFSPEFNKAVEQKVTAQQSALTALNKLEQIKYEAEQKVTSAKAEADSLRLQKQEITPELLQLRQIEVQSKALDIQKVFIEKWDGKLSNTLILGGNNNPLILGLTGDTEQKVNVN